MLRGAAQWLPGYLLNWFVRPRGRANHVIWCLADHFEPFGRGATPAAAAAEVAAWCHDYPAALGDLRDSDGRPPRHTFFYPADEYDSAAVSALAGLCARGFGELEVHLHHRADTAATLAARLVAFRDRLRHAHGALGTDAAGAVRYGFVHGNWALCNSRPDGDWCGVDAELGVLAGTGCYADFTFPSAPSPTQPRLVNAIYHATDRPGGPRGHDRGVRARAGAGPPPAGALLLVQGPLALDWGRRKWGLLPRLDNAALTAANPPAPRRARLWVRQRVQVAGRPDWVFVKLHTHGCAPGARAALLGAPMREVHRWLAATYRDVPGRSLHYVTARELANVVRAALDGRTGDPGAFRDYAIRPPPHDCV